MQKIKVSFAHRLTRHIILAMLFTMLVTSSLILIFSMTGITMLMDDHFDDIMDTTGEKVTGMLDIVEVSGSNVLDEVEYYVEYSDEIFTALVSELELNNRLTGCGVGFVEEYYPECGKWFEPYASFDDNGNAVVAQIGGPDHDYFKSEWYRTGLTAGGGNWSNPYFDESGAKEIVCTYTLPVHDSSGRTVGVLGADISLNWLSEQMQNLVDEINHKGYTSVWMEGNTEARAYSFIIAPNGEYIYHPDPSHILVDSFRQHAESSDELLLLSDKMMSGDRGKTTVMLDGVKSEIFYAPVGHTGWAMAIVVPFTLITFPGVMIGSIILFLMLLGLGIVFWLSYHNIRKASRPLTQLAESAEEIAKGNFDVPMPKIRYKDEIYLLKESFNDMQHSLSDYVDKLSETTARSASLDRELGIARNIQMSMLPKKYPAFPDRTDVDVFGRLTPAKAVGGDLFDYYIKDNLLYFCIGDVSGKGVPAALVMAVMSSQFRTLSVDETNPASIMCKINEYSCARNDTLMFMTMFAGVLDLETGHLRYCNAGHNPPVLIEGANAKFLKVNSNIALGVDPGFEFQLQEATVKPGSILFLYTDGLTEATNVSCELYGEERMTRALAGASSLKSPVELIEMMEKSIQDFVGEAEQSDDLTLVAINCKYKTAS